ncbi:MAG: glycosyltransferase [Candidatus Nanoarchaeia archaeon]|jgi:GT2 family glycosyltransferase
MTEHKRQDLLVAVFTHDRTDILPLNLLSLLNQSYQLFDVLIVDDASTIPITQHPLVYGFITKLKSAGHNIILVRAEQNNGIAFNRAKVIKTLKDYKYIMDLNDDHVLDRDCLKELMTVLTQEDVVAVGSATPLFIVDEEKVIKKLPPKLEPFSLNKLWVDGNELQLTRDVDTLYVDDTGSIIDYPIECDHISQFMYKPEFLQDDELPLEYSVVGFTEETDLSLRLKRNSGKKLMFLPSAINWHVHYPKGGVRTIQNESLFKALTTKDYNLFKTNWLEWVKQNGHGFTDEQKKDNVNILSRIITMSPKDRVLRS